MWPIECGGVLLYPGQGDVVEIAAEPLATLADLVDAFEALAELPGLSKKRLPLGCGECLACPESCCTDSLILLDSLALGALAPGLLSPDLAELGVPALQGPPCPLLVGRMCSSYATRPLICRLFLCTEQSSLLQSVVYEVIGHLMRNASGRGLASWDTAFRRVAGAPAREAVPSSDGPWEMAVRALLETKVHKASYARDLADFVVRWLRPGPAALGEDTAETGIGPQCAGAQPAPDYRGIALSHVVCTGTARSLFRLAGSGKQPLPGR